MQSLKFSRKWHALLIWPALVAVLIYVLSALTHPLMAWTGPQAKVMFPPSGIVTTHEASGFSEVLKQQKIESAKIVKIVPYEDRMLLQVTESEHQPRRYFDLISQNEIPNQDQQQAIWLGQHYLKQDLDISHIEYITDFRHDYPSINRLIPVYKINYATEDNLSVFIHTETQALAGITNDWKNFLRSIFQLFHSFTWLDDYEPLRLLLISSMVLISLFMSVTGFILLIKIKRKQPVNVQSRRWHRRIGWVVTIPFFLFSISGLYHLVFNSFTTPNYGMRLSQNIDPYKWPTLTLPNAIQQHSIHQISLIENHLAKEDSNRYLFRLSVSAPEAESANNRAKRFAGRPIEKQSIYINKNGNEITELERKLVSQAAQTLNPNHAIEHIDKIIRFGPTYDFRNKRLPVWQVDFENGKRQFIDPVSLILVDQNTLSDRAERFSFSFLHKWNMLVPLTGRFYRDVIIVAILSFIGILTILGVAIHLGKRKSSVQQDNSAYTFSQQIKNLKGS